MAVKKGGGGVKRKPMPSKAKVLLKPAKSARTRLRNKQKAKADEPLMDD